MGLTGSVFIAAFLTFLTLGHSSYATHPSNVDSVAQPSLTAARCVMRVDAHVQRLKSVEFLL